MIATHLIFGAYGFWLPNDPRGSWSDFVGSWNIFRYGPATTTNQTRSAAYVEHDHARRLAAKENLVRPAVDFSGLQARAVGQGFANYARRSDLKVFACAILPDHVHLVTAQPRLAPEQLVIQLKGAATKQLLEEGIHPFGNLPRDPNGRPPKCFARGEWKVFLDKPEDVWSAVRYVEDNPLKEGKKAQRWSFVVRFDGQRGTRSAAQSLRVAANKSHLPGRVRAPLHEASASRLTTS